MSGALQPVVGFELGGVAVSLEAGTTTARGSVSIDASVDGVLASVWTFDFDGSMHAHEVARLGNMFNHPAPDQDTPSAARVAAQVARAGAAGTAPPRVDGWNLACSVRLCDIPRCLVAPVVAATAGGASASTGGTSGDAGARPVASYRVDGVAPRVVVSLTMQPWALDWRAFRVAIGALNHAASVLAPPAAQPRVDVPGDAEAKGDARTSAEAGAAGSSSSEEGAALGFAQLMLALHKNNRPRSSMYASNLTHPSLGTPVWIAVDLGGSHAVIADDVTFSMPALYLKSAPLLGEGGSATRLEWTLRGAHVVCGSSRADGVERQGAHVALAARDTPLLAADVVGDVVVRVSAASSAPAVSASGPTVSPIEGVTSTTGLVPAKRRPGSVAAAGGVSRRQRSVIQLPVLVHAQASVTVESLSLNVTDVAVRVGLHSSVWLRCRALTCSWFAITGRGACSG